MKKVLFLLMFPIIGFGQGGYYDENKSDVSKICDFYRGNSFASNTSADNALDKILSVTGMSKRFVLYPCSNIENCLATSYKGIRYILYDKYFMQEIANNTSSWSKISILAHEVGHHVNGHSIDLLSFASGQIDAPSLEESRQMELEADEYSGFVMQKLGASLSQAQAALKKYASTGDDSYSSHPSKLKRLAAVERGYIKAKSNNSSNLNNALNAEYYFYRAQNAQKNKIEYRIENYTKAINLNFKMKDLAYINRANEYANLNKYYEAISDYNKAIEIGTDYVQAYVNRGRTYEFLNDINNAYLDYDKATEMDKDYAESFYRRGCLLKSLIGMKGAKDIELSFKAYADFCLAINKNPNYADAYFKRGVLTIETSCEKAIKDFDKAIELINFSNDYIEFDCYYNRGYCKNDLKDYYGAIADYTKAISLNPDDGSAYINRGNSKYDLKDYYGAIADYTKAISLDPNDADAYKNRGNSKYHLNQDYCPDFKKVCELGGDCGNYNICK